MMSKVLITSALPYINNTPHLGNLIGSTLSADVFARHKRLSGAEVLFVCGADEHGTATQIKARERGVTPKQLCDEYIKIHKEIYDWFNISFDVWGRTHTDTHTKITQDIFLLLYANKFIFEQEVEQLYDTKEKQFLADRFVEGECPFCNSKGARGDQCDSCGKLITATKLINPVSKLSGSKPIIKISKHLFIDLPKLKPELLKWYDNVKNGFSDNARRITEHWLSEIRPRAITRDLSWGVPVPIDGFKDKVFYVWFDAPIGYISITAHARNDWKEWWFGNDTKLVQFMGKDNVVFHTVIFPASLIGTKQDWNLVSMISATEYLNMRKGKFSKSKKQGVFGDDCIKLEKKHGISADEWRYYLIINRPESSDTEFSWDDFAARVNNELVANYGNLVHRTIHFAYNKCSDVMPLGNDKSEEFYKSLAGDYNRIISLLDKARLRESLKETMMLVKRANQFFQHQKPWDVIKKDRAKAASIIRVIASVVKDISILLYPHIPSSSRKVWSMLGLNDQKYSDIGLLPLSYAKEVKNPKILFNSIDCDIISEIQGSYSSYEDNASDTDSTVPLDLRVARVIGVDDHPDADKLYIIKLDLGSEVREVVAGLKPYYSRDELLGKHAVIVANLKPAKLRGFISDGMLLAGEKEGIVGLLLAASFKPGYSLTKNASCRQVSFDDFLKHSLTATKKGLFIDGKLIEANISVDRDAYGPLR